MPWYRLPASGLVMYSSVPLVGLEEVPDDKGGKSAAASGMKASAEKVPAKGKSEQEDGDADSVRNDR